MATEFKLPDLGEGIHEAEVLAVKVKAGDVIVEDQPIFEVETDKAVVEIPSPFAGKVEKILVSVGEIVKVGTTMITFEGSGSTSAPTAKITEKSTTKVESQAHVEERSKELSHAGKVPAAPATRRLAREMGIDINLIAGTGPAGRVLNEDLMSFKKGGTSHKQVAASSKSIAGTEVESTESFAAQVFGAQAYQLPSFDRWGATERVPLRSLRRKIALNMAQSWAHVPRVSHFDEADITLLESLRQKHETSIIKHGGKLTLTVFALRAVVSALKQYPQFNSSLDEETGEIVLKHYYNIGVAVASSRGLIVPVVHNVDKRNIGELAGDLAELAQKARDGKIELDKLQGGSFTITNIGAIGGTGMVPMVNFPEAAILGMARGQERAVVRNGNIEARWILPLSISFDHRIADGAEAALFVRHVANLLEDPLQLLGEV